MALITATKAVPVPHPAKALMASRRMTIRELASEVGVNASSLGRILNNYEEPWPKLRTAVAEALGITEDACWRSEVQ